MTTLLLLAVAIAAWVGLLTMVLALCAMAARGDEALERHRADLGGRAQRLRRAIRRGSRLR